MEYKQEELFTKALVIATEAHKEQRDKSGNLYTLHPIAVSNRVEDIKDKTLALLHDYIEDTDAKIEDLFKEGFDKKFVSDLYALTKEKDVAYSHYVLKLSLSESCKKVKMADLEENMNLDRLSKVKNADINRVMKYVKHYNCLKYDVYTDEAFKGVDFDLYKKGEKGVYRATYDNQNKQFLLEHSNGANKKTREYLKYEELARAINNEVYYFI